MKKQYREIFKEQIFTSLLIFFISLLLIFPLI